MSAPTVILFDVYKTLIDIHLDESRPELYRALSAWLATQELRVEPFELQQLFLHYARAAMDANHNQFPDIEIGQVFEKIVAAIAPAQASPPGLIGALAHLFRQHSTLSLTLYPGIIEVLEALHGQTRLGIVSNAQRLFTLPELSSLGFQPLFDCIVFSSDTLASKPSPLIFQRALACLDASPAEAIHVGDNLFDDVLGAQQLGMRTVWIERPDSPPFPTGVPKPTPDVIVSGDHYDQLRQILMAMLAR